MLRPHHYMKKKIRDNVKSLLSIIVDDTEIMNSLESWLFHMDNFHNKFVILPTNKIIANVFEEEQDISCLTPTGYINGKDKPRCYLNSSF